MDTDGMDFKVESNKYQVPSTNKKVIPTRRCEERKDEAISWRYNKRLLPPAFARGRNDG